MARNKITGKVAAIINSRELVINVGANHGVELEMVFRILDNEKKVVDPDSGEELGSVRREKIRVKIVTVEEKLAVGRTYQTYRVNVGGSELYGSNPLREALGFANPPKYVTRVRTLEYDEGGIDYSPLDENSSIVSIGDLVEEVLVD